ncbi:MAG TPA: PQQ-binding-like beta-propeller repeat protein [Actinomycetota bacterium]|nr:PQQ-binding-like beta-propeller repeat protein [Actinomycetota bacterium]
MPRRILFFVLATILVASAPAASSAAESCAAPDHAGGDWRSYGHDLSNTRTQPDENVIGTTQAAALEPRRVFSATAAGGEGNFNSTPVIADGCMYVATDLGDVYALNADTFSLVWSAKFFVAQTRLGGVITGAPAVHNGALIVPVSDAGHPFVVALDQFTGEELWRTVIDDRPGSFTNASPVVFDGMVFQGFSGDEYVPEARGGYAIIDADDGALLEKRYTIPDAEFGDGYWGGSIWSTAVYEPTARALFVGTGNPASHDREHRYTNALVRIDADRSSDSFGDIVDAYKGTVDQYYPGLDRQPACASKPDVEYGDAWSLTCLQLDLDFGASPNLFTDARGNVLLGALQKSGVYHVVYADTMQQAWTSVVGTPCFVCNAASPAVSGGRIFAAGSQPGQIIALDQKNGGYEWVTPLADFFHYESVSTANGVVYATDLYGNLNAIDAANGIPLLKRSIGNDVGGNVGGVQSGGVAIARNTVYAPAAGFIVAYR